MDTLATFDDMAENELAVVAKLHHTGRDVEDVRHDGERFYRPICAIGEGRTLFPDWMLSQKYLRGTYRLLLQDERNNGLETSSLTWPSKARGDVRPIIPFAGISGFELLEQSDVAQCEAEIARLTAAMRVQDGKIWIQCGEPCFRLRNTPHQGLVIELSFSDQDEGSNVEENFISALDPQGLRDQWEIVSSPKDRERGFVVGSVDIIEPSVFTTDFDDIGFTKYARTVASAIASYLAADGWNNDGRRLMESEVDDVDLWNRLRRTIRAMNDAGTANAGDDEIVMQGSELWARLGGAHHVRSRYCSGETVGRWFDSLVRRWMDRRIELDAIVSQLPKYR
jgi:hypothetical protein